MNPQETEIQGLAGIRRAMPRALGVVLGLMALTGACGPKPAPAPPVNDVDAAAAISEPPPAPPTPPAPKTLYDRLGGKEGVAQLVETFVQKLFEEKKLARVFAKVKKDPARETKFKEMLAEQLCAETGGGCTYSGKEMKVAHKGLRISNAEWHLFIEKLTAVLVDRKVDEDDQSEIFSMLGKMQKEVVLR